MFDYAILHELNQQILRFTILTLNVNKQVFRAIVFGLALYKSKNFENDHLQAGIVKVRQIQKWLKRFGEATMPLVFDRLLFTQKKKLLLII